VALLTGGCDLPGKPDSSSRPESRALTGIELFKTHCAGCHGANGILGPAPPLNDPIFIDRMPREEIVRVIASGRPGTPMPAFANKFGGPLTEVQIRELAQNLPHSRSEPEVWRPAWLALDRPIAKGDAQRGWQVFQQACAPCHGHRGEGTDGAGAINNRQFLELTSDRLLRRLIITGRPDLGMPDYRSSDGRDDDFQALDEKDVNDLVALLAAWRRGENVE
jgi:mono/diheme cytochrome c family protein